MKNNWIWFNWLSNSLSAFLYRAVWQKNILRHWTRFCRKFDLGRKSFRLFAQSVSLIRPQPRNKQEITTYYYLKLASKNKYYDCGHLSNVALYSAIWDSCACACRFITFFKYIIDPTVFSHPRVSNIIIHQHYNHQH